MGRQGSLHVRFVFAICFLLRFCSHPLVVSLFIPCHRFGRGVALRKGFSRRRVKGLGFRLLGFKP